MKQIQKYTLKLGVFLMLLIQAFSLNAADTNMTLGGGSGQLDIRLMSNGNFHVFRNGDRQIFRDANVFVITIGGTSYESSALNREDVESSNSGTHQTRAKKYSGTHSGKAFSVTITFIYDTSTPDYFIIKSDVDMENITSGAVSLAFGFDAYVNGCDGGAAITVPNLGYNGVNALLNLTQAQVRSLRLVGTQNRNGAGSLIALLQWVGFSTGLILRNMAMRMQSR